MNTAQNANEMSWLRRNAIQVILLILLLSLAGSCTIVVYVCRQEFLSSLQRVRNFESQLELESQREERVAHHIQSIGGSAIYNYVTTTGPMRKSFGRQALTKVKMTDKSVDATLLAEIMSLKHLHVLHLDSTDVTDLQLCQLAQVAHLVELNLSNTNVSDVGVTGLNLKRMPNLRHIDLSNTRVGDGAMENMQCLTDVFYIDLSGTRVSHLSPQHINGLTNLTCLCAKDTNVTFQDIAALRSQVPRMSNKFGARPFLDVIVNQNAPQ